MNHKGNLFFIIMMLMLITPLFMSFTRPSQDSKRDNATFSQTSLEWEHHEIHEGAHFRTCFAASKASGDSIQVGITTPDDTKWTHLLIEVIASAEVEFSFYENATLTGGDPLTAFNSNRNSSIISGLTLVSEPEASAFGTRLEKIFFGDGKKFGGESRQTSEWVLKQNADYLITLASAAASNEMNIRLFWYELKNID